MKARCLSSPYPLLWLECGSWVWTLGPQLPVLSGKVVSPLGGGVWLKEVGHCSRPWGFWVWSHFLFIPCFLIIKAVCSFPTLHAHSCFPFMLWTKTNLVYLKLFLVRCVVTAMGNVMSSQSNHENNQTHGRGTSKSDRHILGPGGESVQSQSPPRKPSFTDPQNIQSWETHTIYELDHRLHWAQTYC